MGLIENMRNLVPLLLAEKEMGEDMRQVGIGGLVLQYMDTPRPKYRMLNTL